MDKRRGGRKVHRIRALACILAVITMAMVVEMLILGFLNKMDANSTSVVLLDQVTSILEENEYTENELVETLKEDYVVRARTVAYILDARPDATGDVQELQKIASLMKIDEIHIFNDEGVIVGGSIPKYYGYSFESGDQMAYFKPMLNDKSLTMCQDVTPNTAEAKNMMYAITWNDAGDSMIQVGIEPVRLLEELRRNEIPEVVSNMPAYEGFNIFVADVQTGEIYGSTDASMVGVTMQDVGIPKTAMTAGTLYDDELVIDGFKAYCKFRQIGDYVVSVTYSTRANIWNFTVALVIELIYLSLAAFIIICLFKRIIRANAERDDQLAILTSMSGVYYSMHLIDLGDDTVIEYTADDYVRNVVDGEHGAAYMMHRIMEKSVVDACRESILEFTDLSTVAERMKGKKIISQEFLGKTKGWFRASFIMIEEDEAQRPTKVFYVTRNIDHDKKREQELLFRSNTDQLTGLYNRRAYEDDLAAYDSLVRLAAGDGGRQAHGGLSFKTRAVESGLFEEGVVNLDELLPGSKSMDDLVFVSMDVNGLKTVNDQLGHAAGDELLLGAVECMKKCLGKYGRLYRMGGDEFAAVMFANDRRLEKVRKEFELVMAGWSGKQVKSLSISCGYVAIREDKKLSMHEVAKLADKRMYEAKSEYYRKNGIERRR